MQVPAKHRIDEAGLFREKNGKIRDTERNFAIEVKEDEH